MFGHSDLDVLCEFSELFSYKPRVCDKTEGPAARMINSTYGDIKMMAQYKANHKTVTLPPHYTKPQQNNLACLYRPQNASGKGKPPSIGFLIPKVASSSFRHNTALLEGGFVEGFCGFMNASFIMDPDVVRFAVVREPVSRFAAAFNQASYEALVLNRSAHRSLFRDNPPWDSKERFAQFLEDVLGPRKVNASAWTLPQTDVLLQIGPDDGRFRLPELDFLVSIDMLDEYMPELGELLGFESQETQSHMSMPGYGAKLESSEAWQTFAGNPLLARSFCDQYGLDYHVFGFELPSWCMTTPHRSHHGTVGGRT